MNDDVEEQTYEDLPGGDEASEFFEFLQFCPFTCYMIISGNVLCNNTVVEEPLPAMTFRLIGKAILVIM